MSLILTIEYGSELFQRISIEKILEYEYSTSGTWRSRVMKSRILVTLSFCWFVFAVPALVRTLKRMASKRKVPWTGESNPNQAGLQSLRPDMLHPDLIWLVSIQFFIRILFQFPILEFTRQHHFPKTSLYEVHPKSN